MMIHRHNTILITILILDHDHNLGEPRVATIRLRPIMVPAAYCPSTEASL